MADPSGPNLTNTSNINDKQGKHDGTGCLMEKLRQTPQSSHGSWTDTTKLLNVSLLEKKQFGSEVMKPQLGKHLDVLQKAFKVHGFRGVSERLERMCATLGGMRVSFPTSGMDSHLFRTCVLEGECFHVEVVLNSGGRSKDVKIKHDGDVHRDGAMRCPELQNLVNEGKWEEIKEHLTGILEIYSIGLDKKQRSRTFSTLQALESDLLTLSKFQGAINSVPNLILKSPLGIVVPRVAGRAMKLVYFVSPYDLVDQKTRTLVADLTAEGIVERGIGHCVTVTIEASTTQHKLQSITLLTPKALHDGKSLPSFMPLNKNNSCTLPAVFTLRLHSPLPVAYSLIKAIQSTTGIELSLKQELTYKPLTELIVRSVLKKKETDDEDITNHLSVALPDQKHSYALHCYADSGDDDQVGALVSKVPLLHPKDVARVIQLLRQQALYNCVLSSCVRQHKDTATVAQEGSSQLAFEVTAVSMQAISVCFEHPFTDHVTTAMFDLSDVTALRCHVSTIDAQGSVSTSNDATATSVFQKCLSLPITMRHIARSLSADLESHIAPPSPQPPPAPLRFITRKVVPHQALHQLSKIGQERRTAFIESSARQVQDSTSTDGFRGNVAGASTNVNAATSFGSVSSSSSQFTPPPPVAAVSNAVSNPAAAASSTGAPLAAVAAMAATSSAHSNTPPPTQQPLSNQHPASQATTTPSQVNPTHAPGIPTPIAVHHQKAQMNLPLSSTTTTPHVQPNATAVAPHSLAQATPHPAARMNKAQAGANVGVPPQRGGVVPNATGTPSQGQATIVSPEVGDDMQFSDHSKVPQAMLDAMKKDKIKRNPMLASLLDQERESPEPPAQSNQHSMLSALLGDAPDPTAPNMPHKGPAPTQANNPQLASTGPGNKTTALSGKRKRKSLGDSQGSGSMGGAMGPHSQLGMSPKRLASEHDNVMGTNKGYPPTMSSAEHNDSSHHHPHPHPHHVPPHMQQAYGGGPHGVDQSSHPHAPMNHGHMAHNPHNLHLSNNMDPAAQNAGGAPMYNNQHHAGGMNPMQQHMNPHMNPGMHHPHGGGGVHPHGLPPGMPPHPQHSNVVSAANFPTQTRVGGASAPPYNSVSSSQPSQPTLNQSSSTPSPVVLPSPTTPHPTHNTPPPHMSPRRAGGGGSGNRGSGSFGGVEESHVSLLANSVDNFIKQESNDSVHPHNNNHQSGGGVALNSSNSSSSVVSTTLVSATSSTMTSPKTVSTSYHTITSSMNTSSSSVTSAPNAHLAQLLNFSVHDSQKMQPPPSQQFTNANMNAKHNAAFHGKLPNAHVSSELVSLLSDDSGGNANKSGFAVKQELLGNIKEEKPSLSHNFSTVDDSFFKTENSVSDPFEFTEAFLGQPTNVDGAFDHHHSSMDTSEHKPSITPSTTPKHSSSSNFHMDKKPHSGTHEAGGDQPSKNVFDHPKKERKKGSNAGSMGGNKSTDKLQPSLNLKININTKTNTIVRQSPHRSESPANVSERSLDGFQGNSTPDAYESSRDSDVFITHAQSGHHHKSHDHNNVDHHHHHHHHGSSSHKSSSSGKKSSDERKKKKKVRSEGEHKHERKRKREEQRLKEEQQKKAKNVYDFDFNESEHLPPIKPTKIKIRTLDGQMSIQTTPTGSVKKLSMSPLPMKASIVRSDSHPAEGGGASGSASSGRSSSKSEKHKSEKKHKPSSKHKSKSSSSEKGKVDKSGGGDDSKLSKTPVVKIKPIHSNNSNGNQGTNAKGGAAATVPTTSVSTPQSAPVRLNSSSPSDAVQPPLAKVPKLANANHFVLSGDSRSKSLSNLVQDAANKVLNKEATVSNPEVNKVIGVEGGKSNDILTNHVSAENKSTAVVSSKNVPSKSQITSPNCVTDKNRPSLTSTSSKSDKSSKQPQSSNGASADENKSRTSIGSESAAKTKTGLVDTKNAKPSLSNSQASTASDSSKTRTPTSSSDTKSRPTANTHNSDASSGAAARSKTPTQLAVPSSDPKVRSASASSVTNVTSNATDNSNKNRALSSSAVSSALTNSSETSVNATAKTSKSSSASDKSNDNRDNRSKHEKNLTGNAQSQQTGNKAAPATKQRKSSLTQVIDKLTKGLDSDSTSSQTKKAQDVYDQIRLEILGHGGAQKQKTGGSTLKFKKKEGKQLTKQDNISSGTPPVVSSKSTTNPLNAVSKQSNLSKQSSSPNVLNKTQKPLTSFRIPKATDNKISQKAGDQRSNASDNKSSLSKGTADPRTVGNENKVVVNKNDPRTAAQMAGGDNKINASKAVSTADPRLKATNPANADGSTTKGANVGVNSIDAKGDHKRSTPNASPARNTASSSQGPMPPQKQNASRANAGEGDVKQNKGAPSSSASGVTPPRNSKIDDISERLLKTRHFLDAVIKPPNEGTEGSAKKIPQSSSQRDPRQNSHHPQSSRERSKSPQVKQPHKSPKGSDPAANKMKPGSVTPPLGKVPSNSSHKYASQSNRPKTPINDLKNSQLASANKSSPPQELRKPEGDLRRPEVESKSTPPDPKSDIPATPDSPPAIVANPVSFYNPAAALGRKPGSGEVRKSSSMSMGSWNKKSPSPVNVPLNKTPSVSAAPKSNTPVVTIPLDKPAPPTKLPLNKTPVIVPLDKTTPTPSSSKTTPSAPAKQTVPSDTPASPIRHESPPASPQIGGPSQGGGMSASNKTPAVVAKAIPLAGTGAGAKVAREDSAPASPDAPASPSPEEMMGNGADMLKTEPVIIASEKVIVATPREEEVKKTVAVEPEVVPKAPSMAATTPASPPPPPPPPMSAPASPPPSTPTQTTVVTTIPIDKIITPTPKPTNPAPPSPPPPMSPRSDISSPEGGLVIDDPEEATENTTVCTGSAVPTTTATASKPLGPPKTIPLERSLCRSPGVGTKPVVGGGSTSVANDNKAVALVAKDGMEEGEASPGLVIKEKGRGSTSNGPEDDGLMDAALGL